PTSEGVQCVAIVMLCSAKTSPRATTMTSTATTTSALLMSSYLPVIQSLPVDVNGRGAHFDFHKRILFFMRIFPLLLNREFLGCGTKRFHPSCSNTTSAARRRCFQPC